MLSTEVEVSQSVAGSRMKLHRCEEYACVAPAGDGLPTLDRQSLDRHRVTSERPFHTHHWNQASSQPLAQRGKDFLDVERH